MTTINSNRITGLATGMDIDEMVTNMLTGEQNKIDKAEQKKQTQTWQQDIYRDVIKDVKGLYDKYFSATSPDYILSSKVFTNITVNSSDNSVITAVASAGANSVNYKFEVSKLAAVPKLESKDTFNNIELTQSSKLGDLGLIDETTFKINYGDDKNSEDITINADDTIETLMIKINKSNDGSVKASFSEMTGKLSIKSTTSGAASKLQIVDVNNNDISKSDSGALMFLGIGNNVAIGSDSRVTVRDNSGNIVRENMINSTNTFTLDGITYTLNGTTSNGESVTISSTKDSKSTVDRIETFIGEYNEIMDSIYSLVTEKKSSDYTPLTEAQKEEMSEKEIENWEEKAKVGILRNDSELRKFIEDMKSSVYSDLEGLGISLNDIGISSVSDYNKPAQLALDKEKFTKALEENGELVYKATTATLEKIKTITYNYSGSSSSIFAKKSGIEKTSTSVNNIFSEQIRKQEERIKELTTKMQKKQEELYAKFASLESSMNTLNSQMNYLVSTMSS